MDVDKEKKGCRMKKVDISQYVEYLYAKNAVAHMYANAVFEGYFTALPHSISAMWCLLTHILSCFRCFLPDPQEEMPEHRAVHWARLLSRTKELVPQLLLVAEDRNVKWDGGSHTPSDIRAMALMILCDLWESGNIDVERIGGNAIIILNEWKAKVARQKGSM